MSGKSPFHPYEFGRSFGIGLVSAGAGHALGLDAVSQVALGTAFMAADNAVRDQAELADIHPENTVSEHVRRSDLLRVRTLEEIAYDRARRSFSGLTKPNIFV